MYWYRKVTADVNDFSPVADALDYFQKEYKDAQEELKVAGKRIDLVAAGLPGIIEYRYAQFQELETILLYFERLESKAIVEKTMWYMTNYNRQINEITAKRYAEVHDDVLAIMRIKLEVANVRNNFIALTKGMETLHYQTSNIVKLRVAGFDDATF